MSTKSDEEFSSNITFYVNGEVQTLDGSVHNKTGSNYTTLLQYLRLIKKVMHHYSMILRFEYHIDYNLLLNTKVDGHKTWMW